MYPDGGWVAYLVRAASVFEGSQTVFFPILPLIVPAEAGWVGRDAILMTGINAIIYILSTLPP